jgi:hypothetical protein
MKRIHSAHQEPSQSPTQVGFSHQHIGFDVEMGHESVPFGPDEN